MAIEVRQMVVKSTVVSEDAGERAQRDEAWEEAFKEEMLAACRKLIAEDRSAHRDR